MNNNVDVKPIPKQLTKNRNGIWCETYIPRISSDLAVHYKKVSEVKSWLETQNSMFQKKGILLLTGPAGCGKTATVKTLCNELSFYVQEWSNPTEITTYDPSRSYSNEFDQVQYIGHKKSFELFVARANRYAALGTQQSAKIILLEHLPAFVYRDPAHFHHVLRSYRRKFPVVIIQSESSAKDDSIRLLFPSDFIQELGMYIQNIILTLPSKRLY